MIKLLALFLLTGLLVAINLIPDVHLRLHEAYNYLVIFFAVQALVFFRLDHIVPKSWMLHLSLVKVVLRFLLSLIFIAILMYLYTDRFSLVIQFVVLYFVFMIFEIVIALTNLRRN
jgi:hypothetical protein